MYNEKLHNLYASPNIIRMIKTRMMRWAGHVRHMGNMRNANKNLIGKFEGEETTRKTEA
jgi:hypothetical protein